MPPSKYAASMGRMPPYALGGRLKKKRYICTVLAKEEKV